MACSLLSYFGACDELVADLLLMVARFDAFGQYIHVGIELGPGKHRRGYRKSQMR